MAAFFKDFSKPIKTVLDDDYTEKKTLKVKFVTANDITITSESELGTSAISASVTGKYKHAPTGFSLDKLQLTKDVGVATEASLANVAPGLAFTFKGTGTSAADLGIEYLKPKVAVKAEVDIVGLKKSKASAVIAHDGVKAGAEVDLKLPSDKASFELGGWKAGLSFTNPSLFAAILAGTGKGGLDYTASALYKVSPPISVAASVTKPAAASSVTVAVGTTYKCNPKTTVKAKVTTASVSAAVIQDVLPKVTLTGSGTVSLKAPSDYKLGFGVTLG